jgi:hypothetical protein
MDNPSPGVPFRTITTSSSAITPYTRALMRSGRARLGSRQCERAWFKKADFKPAGGQARPWEAGPAFAL